MLTVDHQSATVESQLAAGAFSCPSCTTGTLRPWGHGTVRSIRTLDPHQLVTFTPRRGRCSTCGATHILLPVPYAARRADTAAVIAQAIEEHARTGAGHRRIAARLGRCEDTVRGWLRAFTRAAAGIVESFTTRVQRAAADAVKIWPAAGSTPVAGAVNLLAAYASVLSSSFPAAGASASAPGALVVSVPWFSAGLAVAGPWLFSSSRPAVGG